MGAFQKMDGIAAVSQGHMDTLFADHGYPEHRMDIIPGGINESIFSPKKLTRPQKLAARESLIDEVNASRQENDIPEIPETSAEAIKSGRVIFGFGRMVEAKGIVNAVKSMKHTLEEHPDAVYVYAGGNIPPKQEEEKRVLEQSLEYAREHGYEDRIVFLGRQDQIKCSEWLDASDVYLHAANLEPFGLAPQEAAATGIPVVLSMNAGVAEVLRNNRQALHVDPLNPEDISKQTSMVLSNPKTLGRRLSDQALLYIEKEATWSGRTSQLLKFAQDAHEYTNVPAPLKTITDADPKKAERLLSEREPSKSQTADQRALMREARGIMLDLVSTVRTGPAVVLEIDNDKLEAEG